MADFDLSTVTAALAQNLRDIVVRTFNSTSPTLRLFPIVQGEGKNCAWDVEGTGAIGENFTDGADVANYGIDTPKMATLSWGLYRSSFKITNLAASAAKSSRSPSGLMRPLARNMVNGARKLAKSINDVAYSGAGTGTTVAGLAIAVKDDNTYAAIDRSSETYFRAKVIDPGALTDITVALIRSDLGQIQDACGEKPDLALCSTAVWNKVAALFTDRERFARDVATFAGGRQVTMDATIDAIVVDGCMFVKDPSCTANVIYYLNTAYVRWETLPHDTEVLPAGAVLMSLEDTQGALGLQVAVYPLSRTGAAGKFTMEAQFQLVLEKPNACGKRLNVNA